MPLGSVRTAFLSLTPTAQQQRSTAQLCIAFPSDSSRSRSRSSKKKKTFVRTDTQVLPAKAEDEALSPHSLCCGPLVVLRPALSLLCCTRRAQPRSLHCSSLLTVFGPLSLPNPTIFATPHFMLLNACSSLHTAWSSLLNACCCSLHSACCAAPLCASLSHCSCISSYMVRAR